MTDDSDLYFVQGLLGPMQNFVYLIGSKRTRECLLVDPAWDTDALLAVAAWRVLPRDASRASADGQHWLSAMGHAYARLARERGLLLVGSATATFYAFLAGAPQVSAQQGVT